MTDRFGLILGNFPVSEDGAGGSDSQLSVDSPRLREATVFWVIKNGDVSPVITACDVHSNIDPSRTFFVGFGIF